MASKPLPQQVNEAKTAAEAAVMLFQLGFTPIRDNGKVPVDKAWQETQYTDEKEVSSKFDGWQGNVGVLTDGFVMLGPNTKEAYDALKAAVPFYDDTLPRMGNNPYPCAIFRRSDVEPFWKGQKIQTNDESLKTMADIWGDGSQFVAWGLHPAGVPYRFTNNNEILPISTVVAKALVEKAVAILGSGYRLKTQSKKGEPTQGQRDETNIFSLVKKAVRMRDVLGTTEKRVMCPLHKQGSSNPAAEIFEDQGGDTIYCHSSGCFGDVIGVYAHQHGIKQFESAKELAKKYNVKVPNTQAPVVLEQEPEETPTVDLPMVYDLGHTPFAGIIADDLRLEGANYRLAIKALSYHVLGKFYQFKIEHGGVFEDSRVNVLYAIGSGGGKNNLLFTTSVAFGALGLESGYITSLHPEQLVGRFEYNRKTKQHEEIRGWLRKPTLQLDEAWSLFANKAQHAEESWKYLSKALDPIGRNRIEKKLTSSPEPLSYEPECTISACVQPRAIPADVVQQGLFRRFTCAFIDARLPDEQEAFTNRLTRDRNNHTTLYSTLHDWKLRNSGEITTPQMPHELDDSLVEYQCEIIAYLRSRGEKGKRLAEIQRFPLQNQLLRLAMIQAAYNGRATIDRVDLDNSFVDTFEFMDSACRYLENCVAASLDYGADWAGATGAFQQALKLLADNGALSYETAMHPKKFYKILFDEHIFDVKDESTLRRRVKIMKTNNWVKTAHGSGFAGIWLSFKPPTVEGVSIFDVNTSEYVRLTGLNAQNRQNRRYDSIDATSVAQREETEIIIIESDHSTSTEPDMGDTTTCSPCLSKTVLLPVLPVQLFDPKNTVQLTSEKEEILNRQPTLATSELKTRLVQSGELGLSASLIRAQWGEPGIAEVTRLSEQGQAKFIAEAGRWCATIEPGGAST